MIALSAASFGVRLLELFCVHNFSILMVGAKESGHFL
jgi:hypothetical protein